MIAVDTNVLIYAHRSWTAEHDAAKAAIVRAAEDARGWGVSVATLAELWSVATHSRARGRPSTGAEVRDYVDALVEDAGMAIWTPVHGSGRRLMRWAADLDIRAARVFDLRIALTALDAGATELWTHDAGFVQVPGLRLRDPLAPS